MAKEIIEYELDGEIFDGFDKLIEHWNDIRWGKSPADARNRMLYWYKDHLGLDPKKTVRVFKGTIRPTGRRKVVND